MHTLFYASNNRFFWYFVESISYRFVSIELLVVHKFVQSFSTKYTLDLAEYRFNRIEFRWISDVVDWDNIQCGVEWLHLFWLMHFELVLEYGKWLFVISFTQ